MTNQNENFKKALKRVLLHEGGYVNHAKDPGGETNYGITKSTAFAYGYHGSMRDIPMSTVEKIYKKQFWDALNCDDYPFSIAFQLFDAGVNHGLGNARRLLQRAIGVADDGIIGPITRDAIKKTNPSKLIFSFHSQRILFYTKLSTFQTFGKGWMRRAVDNLEYAGVDL